MGDYSKTERKFESYRLLMKCEIIYSVIKKNRIEGLIGSNHKSKVPDFLLVNSNECTYRMILYIYIYIYISLKKNQRPVILGL